jgi:protein-tyrosine phosphatase
MRVEPCRPLKVLFVCLGNICRSPTAEGVFRHYVRAAGLDGRLLADSAGTGDYHVGEPPDRRACATAFRRGYRIDGLRARQVRRSDFEEFDYILGMDEQNLRALKRLCPSEHLHKVRLLTEFSGSGPAPPVPDPYFGGPRGFEHALDQIENAVHGLLRHLQAQLPQ